MELELETSAGFLGMVVTKITEWRWLDEMVRNFVGFGSLGRV